MHSEGSSQVQEQILPKKGHKPHPTNMSILRTASHPYNVSTSRLRTHGATWEGQTYTSAFQRWSGVDWVSWSPPKCFRFPLSPDPPRCTHTHCAKRSTCMAPHHADSLGFGQLQGGDPLLPLHLRAGLEVVGLCPTGQHNTAIILPVKVRGGHVDGATAGVGHFTLISVGCKKRYELRLPNSIAPDKRKPQGKSSDTQTLESGRGLESELGGEAYEDGLTEAWLRGSQWAKGGRRRACIGAMCRACLLWSEHLQTPSHGKG